MTVAISIRGLKKLKAAFEAKTEYETWIKAIIGHLFLHFNSPRLRDTTGADYR
jgi:hypothetical protein